MSTMSNSLAEPKAESLATAGLSQGDVSDFFALLKPRVMFLVVFTALVGMVVSHPDVHPVVAFVSLLMIAVGGGASGCLNMWWDADIDAIMTRTRKRPIPAGKIQPGEALAFGMTLSVGSVIILGLASNWLAAGLLAFTIFFYVVDLFHVAEALDAAEHRHRRRGRRPPPDRGAGRGDRSCRPWTASCCSPSSSCGRRRTSGRSPW